MVNGGHTPPAAAILRLFFLLLLLSMQAAESARTHDMRVCSGRTCVAVCGRDATRLQKMFVYGNESCAVLHQFRSPFFLSRSIRRYFQQNGLSVVNCMHQTDTRYWHTMATIGRQAARQLYHTKLFTVDLSAVLHVSLFPFRSSSVHAISLFLQRALECAILITVAQVECVTLSQLFCYDFLLCPFIVSNRANYRSHLFRAMIFIF